ncbi:M48 family metallopeptidase [Streptomyces sp. NPDC003554]
MPIVVMGFATALVPGAVTASREMAKCEASVAVPPPAAERGKGLAERFGDASVRELRVDECFGYLSALRPVVVIAGLAVLAVVVLALLLYAVMPAWQIRRQHLVALTGVDIAALDAELENMRREADVTQVAFLMDPLDLRVSGRAFGLPRRRYVVLSRGLIHCCSIDPELFRAIVLHELGHIRNRDIDAAYLAVAIWRAFAVLVLAPAVVLAVLSGPEGWIFLGGRLAGLAVVVLLIRNGVLRSRELHADARVAQWGMSAPLARALDAPRHNRQGLGYLRSTLARVHPEPSQRRAALNNTDALTQVGWWDGAALGITTTIAYNTTPLVIGWFAPRGIGSQLAPILLFVLPAACGVTIATFRVNLTALTQGRRPRVDGFALGLGTGIVAGVGLAVQAAFLPPDRPYPSFPGLGLGGWLAWAALVVVATWLYVRWFSATARLWMPYVVTARSLGRPVLLGAVLATLSLPLWLPFVIDLPNYANLTKVDVLPEVPSATIVLGLAAVPAVLTLPSWGVIGTLAVVWGLPLMATLPPFQRHDTPARPWATSDSVPYGWYPPKALASPVRALSTGLIVTVAALTIMSVCYVLAAGVRIVQPELLSPVNQILTWLPFVLGATAVTAAALIATARAPGFPTAHGLLAAFIPGLPVILGGEVMQSYALCMTGRCTGLDLKTDWTLCLWLLRWTLLGSAVLSVPIAVLVALLGQLDRSTNE